MTNLCFHTIVLIVLPGAYKVGEVAIWRMRKYAMEQLGATFDIKKFHSCLLDSGPMPLDTLEQHVKAWVASMK
jgi:uncharacterized protein (DUF885 family)